ncbi:MAG: hypothetical protein KA226_09365, partial [Gemmatimonadales bacterium]|nr:hypothetical protein [Gemmatimonadales bacterium]
MRFDLLNAKPAEPPKLDALRRPVLRHDNPARDALEWACDLLGHITSDILDGVTAYDVTSDGFAFDITFSGVRAVAHGIYHDGPPLCARWYATIDFEGKRCTRVEVVRRG